MRGGERMNDNTEKQIRELNERITVLEERVRDGKNYDEFDSLQELSLAFKSRLEQERPYMNNAIWYAINGISVTALILAIISIVKQVIL
jgi:hypothetical protein